MEFVTISWYDDCDSGNLLHVSNMSQFKALSVLESLIIMFWSLRYDLRGHILKSYKSQIPFVILSESWVLDLALFFIHSTHIYCISIMGQWKTVEETHWHTDERSWLLLRLEALLQSDKAYNEGYGSYRQEGSPLPEEKWGEVSEQDGGDVEEGGEDGGDANGFSSIGCFPVAKHSSALHIVTHLILTTPLWSRGFYYFHFIDEKIESYRN